jgi:hypothetical protein
MHISKNQLDDAGLSRAIGGTNLLLLRQPRPVMQFGVNWQPNQHGLAVDIPCGARVFFGTVQKRFISGSEPARSYPSDVQQHDQSIAKTTQDARSIFRRGFI